MAQIDLKNTRIYIEDGYSIDLQVGVTPVAEGDSTIAVTGGTKAIPVGASFINAGTEYTVTASVGGSTPTSISISPNFVGTLATGATISIAGNRLEVKIGEGNLSYTEKKKYKYIRDRGRLDTVTLDDEETVEVSMEFTWEFLSSASGDPPTIEEALKQKGAASNWVSSSADPCEPYAVTIRAVNDVPCADVDNEIIKIRDFRYESLEHSVRDGRVSVKGNANITEAEVTRGS